MFAKELHVTSFSTIAIPPDARARFVMLQKQQADRSEAIEPSKSLECHEDSTHPIEVDPAAQ